MLRWTCLILVTACAVAQEKSTSSGPVVGHVDQTSARVWVRATAEGPVRFRLLTAKSEEVTSLTQVARNKTDLCVVFHATGLTPGTPYSYTLSQAGKPIPGADAGHFRTAPDDIRTRVRLVFGSCANDIRRADTPVWAAILREHPDAFVLLGDTPYIDSTKLDIQRKRYDAFFSWSTARPVFRSIPTWATWDDHDFGRNDTDGVLPNKAHSRQAFVEHHAQASFGDGKAGIYTRFRWGPVEVWLIDARWFANTAPSPVDPTKRTLLGKAQWEWLQRTLAASDATFKLVASGMIWNGAVRPLKRDHWETWAHERDALFRFIGEKKISGVVLIGGDIHRSRALRYPPKRTGAGYPLTELITSPMANSVIATAKQPSPWLLHDAAETETFLRVDIDTTTDDPVLHATIRTPDRRVLFEVTLQASKLRDS